MRKFLLIGLISINSFGFELLNLIENSRTPIEHEFFQRAFSFSSEIQNFLLCEYSNEVFTDFFYPQNEDKNSLILISGEVEGFYLDGKVFDRGTRRLLRGEKKDVFKETVKTLKWLTKKSENFSRLISKLQVSPHKIYIKKTKGISFLNLMVKDKYEHNNAYAITNFRTNIFFIESLKIPQDKIGGSSIVSWGPNSFSDIKIKAVALGHELYHAYDAARGLLDYRIVSREDLEMIGIREYRAVHFENLLREDLNIEKRTRYSSREGEQRSVVISAQGSWPTYQCY